MTGKIPTTPLPLPRRRVPTALLRACRPRRGVAAALRGTRPGSHLLRGVAGPRLQVLGKRNHVRLAPQRVLPRLVSVCRQGLHNVDVSCA